MRHSRFSGLSRRNFLASLAASAVAAPALFSPLAAGRKTDTLRLSWGFANLTFIAKERGELEKTLARDGIKVEWIGPFPNHAPTLQAVTGGSADLSFGGSTTPALAAIIAGSPLLFTQFFTYKPRTTAIIARDGSGVDKVEDLAGSRSR
jgi:sulfonate transport system substrate-binding protein